MHDNGLPYQPMTEEQYSEMHADLMAVAQSRCGHTWSWVKPSLPLVFTHSKFCANPSNNVFHSHVDKKTDLTFRHKRRSWSSTPPGGLLLLPRAQRSTSRCMCFFTLPSAHALTRFYVPWVSFFVAVHVVVVACA